MWVTPLVACCRFWPEITNTQIGELSEVVGFNLFGQLQDQFRVSDNPLSAI